MFFYSITHKLNLGHYHGKSYVCGTLLSNGIMDLSHMGLRLNNFPLTFYTSFTFHIHHTLAYYNEFKFRQFTLFHYM
jgi:hypothetical protein